MANITPGFELVETKNMVMLQDVQNLLNSLWELPAHKSTCLVQTLATWNAKTYPRCTVKSTCFHPSWTECDFFCSWEPWR